MPDGTSICRHCDKAVFAVWRCKDCVLATPMCRACMRRTHTENPFHRIEQWNGAYFRPAELWEVGAYLLVRHHSGEGVCETLKLWCNQLETSEAMKDSVEQDQLHLSLESQLPVPAPGPREAYFDDTDIDMGEPSVGEDDNDDGDDDCDEDKEIEDVNPYLRTAGASAGAGLGFAGTFENYVRVVHSNGLHHIAMVSCQCHGQDFLPLDLFASQLLPASFIRIRTLFTAQVLDMFRLCNLELKASAYQYYQLLRRLTRPMAPAEVINLYREFRRMSRLWRWMKKLKWAGYASNTKKVNEVKAGELAIYCPACPQPGVNIPENWKDDPARQVKLCLNILLLKIATDGCINVFLWPMAISKLITFGRRMQQTMCYSQREVVWYREMRNICHSLHPLLRGLR
jgi:hypothetical protein